MKSWSRFLISNDEILEDIWDDFFCKDFREKNFHQFVSPLNHKQRDILCKSHQSNLQTITHAAILHKIIYQSINLTLASFLSLINCQMQSESREMSNDQCILSIHSNSSFSMCATANWRDSHKELNTKGKEAGIKIKFRWQKISLF